MAATLIQNVSNQGTAATLAIGSGQGWAAPTAGQLLVAWANSDATVTINNSMTAGPSVVDGNGAYVWYKIATGAESSFTFTLSGSTTITAGILSYSGVTATPFDVQNSSTTTGVQTGSTTAVSVTATNSIGDLFVAVACLHEDNGQSVVASAPVWTNSFTNRKSAVVGTINSTPYLQTFVADFQNTGAATVSTGVSWSGSLFGDRQELLIAFKLAAAGGGSPAITFAPKRRRVGLPPRRTVRQGQVSTPVRAQLNPPILPTDARERRRFLVPVKRAEIASPVTAQVVAPVTPAVPQLTGATPRQWLSRNRAQGAADGPLTAQDGLPVTTTRRRLAVPSRRARVAAPELGAARDFPDVVARGSRLPRIIRRGRAVAPVQTQVTAINPTITATVFGRLRLVARLQPRGKVNGPVPAQQTVVTNPTITATVFGRLRSVGRVQPRARIRTPAPAQQAAVTNPTITATVFGRLRSVGRVQPRAKVNNPVPVQTSAPSGFGRLRLIGRIQSRARIRNPALAQQAAVTNPTITATVFGRLRLVGRIQPRAKVNNPVPAQQAVAANPTITATVFGRLRSVGRLQPRARIRNPVPAQQAAVTNPSITATVFGRLRSVGRVQPRAKVNTPVPAQTGAPSVFGRLRLTGRVQPRARIRTPAPVQAAVTNPSITATVFGRLRSIGRIQPRARINEPVPAQQQAVPNPKITSTMFGRLRLSGRTNRIPRIVKPIPAQVNPLYPVKPSRVIAVRGFSRRRGVPVSAPQVQPTAETRTVPATGLRGLRRVWLKIRRKNVTPVPGQVTTLEGPLVITDSSGGVGGARGGIARIGGVYDSDDAVSPRRGGTARIGPEKSDDAVTGKYDSDSDTL